MGWGDGGNAVKARRYRKFVLWVGMVAAIGQVAVAQGPLTYRITPDHAAQLFFPGMNPPLSLKWSVNLSSTVILPDHYRKQSLRRCAAIILWLLTRKPARSCGRNPRPADLTLWSGPAYDNGLVFAAPGFSDIRERHDVRLLADGWARGLVHPTSRRIQFR